YLNQLGMENTYDIIKRLKKERYINDFEMIKRLKYKGYSYQALKEKLRYYQFDESQIEQALSTYDEKIPLKRAFHQALKKYEKEAYQKKQQKIYRYLLSKGLSEENVQSTMGLF